VATAIRPALFHTQGGLLVDDSARVTRERGGVVPGLWAAGGAAAGISGSDGSKGYVSGNGLLSALGLGLIAGRSAATAAGSSAPLLEHSA
jgi:fumarate reductase flavoprotein subunit